MQGKEIFTVGMSILSGLVAVTALLLGQVGANNKSEVDLRERLVRIEENQGAVRRDLDSLANELTYEIRENRDASRKDGQKP